MQTASASEASNSGRRRNALAYHPVELLHEWEMRTNRPRRREHDDALLARWSPGIDSTQGVAPLAHEPELMIVLTTFGRPQLAARLLAAARAALDAAQLTEHAALLVLHDAC